jgi:nucleoside-diphosphate-sugar epimerase
MKIAVAGGSGGMGRHLVPFLLQQGHSVVSIDRVLPAASSMFNPSLAHLIADTRNYGEYVGSIRGCDALIHLAAIPSPVSHPDAVVYADNTTSSYNALSAAATVGIQRICLASSINAIGGVFSRAPRYDYFPIDERHPTYAEEAYALSKWVLEQQADAFARRYNELSIASLRFHWLVDSLEQVRAYAAVAGDAAIRHLWSYTLFAAANRACHLAVTAEFRGHEVFYITAPHTTETELSVDLAGKHYPNTAVRGDLSGQKSFFDCGKAARILGWHHEE